MKVVIIEDENLATEKLERYLLKYNPETDIIAKLTSVETAVSWFSKEESDYDIILMDVQLTDGLSFEIFEVISITKPVIFITAYDEFAIDAFKLNSIDYILKPIRYTELTSALNKLKKVKSFYAANHKIKSLKEEISNKNNKERFMVRLGNYIHTIETETEIAMFYAEGRTVFLVTNKNKKYILDFTIKDLMAVLNPKTFFRVNRTYIVNIKNIDNVVVYSNSRLKINSKVKIEELIIVSRDKVSNFKNWFEGIYSS